MNALHMLSDYNIYLYSNDAYIEDRIELEFMNQMDLVIYVQVTHPWNYCTVNEHMSSRLSVPFLQITWNTELCADNIIHYDYWVHSYEDPIYDWGRVEYRQKPKRGVFSCLNNVCKSHRAATVIHLLEKHKDKTLLTLSNLRPSPHSEEEHTISTFFNTFRNFNSKLSDRVLMNLYNQLPIQFDRKIDGAFVTPFWVHPAYTEYYVNIVTEHDFVSAFVSEKSMKALLCEQIPIFVSGPGTVDILRRNGFDLFDDIIDHSYDRINDPFLRLEEIFKVIDNVADLDWAEIYEQTARRRKSNRLRAMRSDGFTELKTKILNYIDKNVTASGRVI